MSVIRYAEEDLDEEEETEKKSILIVENPPFNETNIMQQPPKLRIAVCGPAKAGKTFLLNAIEQSYLERFENPLRHYMHMNRSLAHELTTFTFTNDICAVQTRDYLANCGARGGAEDDFLRTCLDELNDHDLILVEDVRHPWEYEVLKEYEFLILYMSTPNDVRFRRSTDLAVRNFMWTKHEQLLSDLKWNHNDAYVKSFFTEEEKNISMQFDLVVNEKGPFQADLWDLIMNRMQS